MSTSLNEQFWLDEGVHELGPIGIAVWSCVIQGQHASLNLPGIYYMPFESLLVQLGGRLMGQELVREVENAFGLILDKGMAIYDEPSRVLRLPKVWKHDLAPNPMQVVGWRTNWLKLPDCEARYAHLPAMRKLTQKCESSDSVMAFDARFGQICSGGSQDLSVS